MSPTSACSSSSVEQGRLASRGLRQDRGHPVQPFELDVALRLGEGRVGPDPGSLPTDEERDGLEPGTLRARSSCPRSTARSTSRTARASTGMMPTGRPPSPGTLSRPRWPRSAPTLCGQRNSSCRRRRVPIAERQRVAVDARSTAARALKAICAARVRIYRRAKHRLRAWGSGPTVAQRSLGLWEVYKPEGPARATSSSSLAAYSLTVATRVPSMWGRRCL